MDLARPLSLARRLRRAVLIRRRLLAALLATISVLAIVRVAAPPAPPTVAVLVAAHDLPAGDRLGTADLVEVPMPVDQAPDGLVDRAAVTGRQLASPVRRGEALTDARLLAPSLLAGYPGSVALPVRIPDPGSVALLGVGDRIDLLGSDPSGAEPTATVVASGVPVLALPAPDAAVVGPTGLGGALVVIAVDPATARHVAASAVSMVLSVLVRR